MILVFSKSWPQSLPKIRFLGQLKRLGLEKTAFFGDGRLGRCGFLKFGGILMNVVECQEKCWDFW